MDSNNSVPEVTPVKAPAASKLSSTITILNFAVIALTITAIALKFISAGVSDKPLESDWWSAPLTESFVLMLVAVIGYSLLLGIKVLQGFAAGTERTNYCLQKLLASSEMQDRSVQILAKQGQVSDKIKELVFKSANIEALRNAVGQVLRDHDFDTADAIVSQAQQLGMSSIDIAEIQEEIEKSRHASEDERIDKAVKLVEELIHERKWAEATKRSAKFSEEFKDHPKITSLSDKIKSSRSAYKAKLLKLYGDAVRVDDVDKSIELLKELDNYLTPQEGEALAESARDVFKKRLHQLGVQFAIAVADHEWETAIETGNEIIKEFPNSRMSSEVKEKMPLLMNRAATQDGTQPLVPPAEGGDPQPVTPQPVEPRPVEPAAEPKPVEPQEAPPEPEKDEPAG